MNACQKIKFKETEIGRIPEDWEVRQIGELVSINELTINKEYDYEEIEYIDISSVDKGKISDRQLLKLSKAPSRAKRIVRNNDILLSTVRPNLKHFAFIKNASENMIASTGFAVITAKRIIPQYLYYYLTTDVYTNYLTSIADAHTSTYPSFNPDIIEASNIAYPCEFEQHAIAKILSDLDSKIELNQRMNKTLESIGRALFKRWFVDFEFPNKDGKPYKSSGGEMVESELGEMPKGWAVKRLGDFLEIERGLSYKGKFLAEEGIPMINLGTMAPHCGFLYGGLKFYAGEFKKRNLVKPGDLVIANTDITQKRDVLGSPAIVPSDLGNDNILFTHHIYAVRAKTALPNLFIYYLLQLKGYKERARGFATGTTVLALPPDAILDFEFVLPTEDIFAKFISLERKIRDKIDVNNLQSKNLSQIRDSLLPRLMSGRIRVPVEVV